ncbi:hypothetical protein [Vibrio algarum]|uniref:Pyruvate:ferredoxin oxidoreductase core domain-containing protein n=1 Tax=Vibrio algarum TaxID=3020714 RepID=A0ABT4YPN1_9VIBR|nr:hypothetical protein [Vibrio sp. KJ40-1]MDB1123515.1 hypothetical protein [Vibrio sp. KJ40-1]
MGSGVETLIETVEHLVKNGEKVGVLKVRLYRPLSTKHLLDELPDSVTTITVLDRTKEPSATADPLYQDIITALMEDDSKYNAMPQVLAGRYGLSSKEFTPAMAKAVFDNGSGKKKGTLQLA